MGNYRRYGRHWNRVLTLFLASGVLLAACSGAVSAPAQPESAPIPEQIQPTDPPPPTEDGSKQLDGAAGDPVVSQPTEEPAQELAPTDVPPATATEEEAPVVVRTELHASNPAEFTLASGGYQFVEFFAFW